MWRTSGGERVLEPVEREVFRWGAEWMLDWIDEEPRATGHEYESGIPAFDQMPRTTRRLAVLYVMRALWEPGVPAPPLRAWNEATLAAVIAEIRTQIDEVRRTELYQYAGDHEVLRDLAAYAQAFKLLDLQPEETGPPSLDADTALDCFNDNLLHDADFNDPELQAYVQEWVEVDDDALPGERYDSEQASMETGVHPNYYKDRPQFTERMVVALQAFEDRLDAQAKRQEQA